MNFKPTKNKLIYDLEKAKWNTMFIISNKIGVSNFIFQLLAQSLKLMESGSKYKDFLTNFGLNSYILYIHREIMTPTEIDRIRTISNTHNVEFFNYNDITPEILVNIANQSIYTHLILDDIKPFYNLGVFNKFIRNMVKMQKKIICGFRSNDTIKKQNFLNEIDIILKINVSILNKAYDIELISNMPTTMIKRTELYYIPIS